MAKDKPGIRTAGDVWHDIDSSVAIRCGKRVFYQLTDQDFERGGEDFPALVLDNGTIERKSPALILAQLPRKADGDYARVKVCPNTGAADFVVECRFDDSRQPGTITTANDGDNKDWF